MKRKDIESLWYYFLREACRFLNKKNYFFHSLIFFFKIFLISRGILEKEEEILGVFLFLQMKKFKAKKKTWNNIFWERMMLCESNKISSLISFFGEIKKNIQN